MGVGVWLGQLHLREVEAVLAHVRAHLPPTSRDINIATHPPPTPPTFSMEMEHWPIVLKVCG